jgi:hypothetical protein
MSGGKNTAASSLRSNKLGESNQAPDKVGTQQVIAGVIELEEVKVAPAAQKTLPKKPKDQLAAIGDLLLPSSGEWTIEQVAAQFNGAQRQKKAIAENLERLEWFRILSSSKPRSESNMGGRAVKGVIALWVSNPVTQTSDCAVLLDPPKNSPRQRVFVPGFLTVAITQSDSHKPLTLKFC